jgi:hypothetical protein
MMRNLPRVVLPLTAIALLIWLNGCYTQLGTTRSEPDYSAVEDDTTGDDYEDSYTQNYYDNDEWGPRYRYGFDYYYPTFALSFSTYDSWYWRNCGWYYYDPFWCGTYYPTIYAGWHWWYPPVSYYSYYYPTYRYRTYASTGNRGTTRTIGNTRGSVVRGGGRGEVGQRSGSSGNFDLPTGYRSSSGTRGTAPPNQPRVSTGRKNAGQARGGTRGSEGIRGGTTRSGSRERTYQPPRTYTPPPRDRGSDRGSVGRSYTPPPSPPPAQSPPANDGGRSTGSSGGTRGGRGR